MIEEWREVFSGYFVSTFGNIESIKRGKRRRLSPKTRGNGYLEATFSIDGKTKSVLVHRLVAEAFIPNPENKPQINHINGVKTDNRVENLEWATATENILHALATGLMIVRQNEDNPRAKFTNEQVRYIRENPDGLTCTQLGEKFDVAHTTISAIQLGYAYGTAGGKIRDRIDTRIPDEVREQIRAEYIPRKHGHGSYALAKKYGLGVTTIKKIIHEN